MQTPVQAVLFLGIIPALILLYISLKNYEGYYKDKIIFLTFLVGIISGVISAVIRILIWPLQLAIIFIIMFAFLEQLIKTIVLNLGRFQFKKETTIYGLSLGLGFGSAFTPFLIISLSNISNETNLYYLALVVLGSIGFILFHGASGAFIGYGIFSGKMSKFLFITILLQIPFNFLNFLADLSKIYSFQNFAIFQAGLVIFGLIFFIYVVKKIMPQILSQKDRRKRSK
jgi:hypothetical protein